MFFEGITAKEDLLTSLSGYIREKHIFNVLWALLKRQNCRSPIDVGEIATKVQSLFNLENSRFWGQGRYEGRQEENNSPGSELLWRAPESPNNVTSRLLSLRQYICFGKTSGSNMEAPSLILAPGAT